MDYIAIFGIAVIAMVLLVVATTQTSEQLKALDPATIWTVVVGVPAGITCLVWTIRTLFG